MGYLGNKPADSYLTLEKQTFTTSATDTYSLDREVSSVNDIELFLNNVRQEPTEAYTISGTTLTLASAITASDSMYCIYQGRAVGTTAPTLPIANFSSTGIDDNATSTAITIDSSENVGIGTSSPSTELHIYKNTTSSVNLKLENSEGSATLKANNDSLYIDSDIHVFRSEASSEYMRIDSSGNVLVGKTSVDLDSAGVEFRKDSYNAITRDGAIPLYINRLTSDGGIIELRKDGTTIGSIGVWNSDNISLYGNSSHAGLGVGTNSVEPIRSNAPVNDSVDLGVNSAKWKDIYATNGTIQTSDQNEKQSIQSLTASEMAVAKRISKLFKTFKWNSAVEEKGDNARTHTGIIAQDVQQAFADEGLEAGNYGMFISGTWWEKEISVDAVAPQEAVYETQTDEEGNEIQVLVQEAVEGKDAYTYIDTKEEATEGYTEKTRLGIRYPELLSFVSSAFEQRLTNIETRLETLENA